MLCKCYCPLNITIYAIQNCQDCTLSYCQLHSSSCNLTAYPKSDIHPPKCFRTILFDFGAEIVVVLICTWIERESRRDEVMVILFLIAVLGLLGYAVLAHYRIRIPFMTHFLPLSSTTATPGTFFASASSGLNNASLRSATPSGANLNRSRTTTAGTTTLPDARVAHSRRNNGFMMLEESDNDED